MIQTTILSSAQRMANNNDDNKREPWLGVPGAVWSPELEEKLNPSRLPTPAEIAETSGKRGALESDDVGGLKGLSRITPNFVEELLSQAEANKKVLEFYGHLADDLDDEADNV